MTVRNFVELTTMVVVQGKWVKWSKILVDFDQVELMERIKNPRKGESTFVTMRSGTACTVAETPVEICSFAGTVHDHRS